MAILFLGYAVHEQNVQAAAAEAASQSELASLKDLDDLVSDCRVVGVTFSENEAREMTHGSAQNHLKVCRERISAGVKATEAAEREHAIKELSFAHGGAPGAVESAKQ